jgi:hypothetical protein
VIRRCPFRCPVSFGAVRDLGLVSAGYPRGSGASPSCSSAWLPAWLPTVSVSAPQPSLWASDHNAVEQPGKIKHCRIGGQENRQDDEDDLKDTAREKRSRGGASCEDRANCGRKERVLHLAPGAGLYVVLRRHSLMVIRDDALNRACWLAGSAPDRLLARVAPSVAPRTTKRPLAGRAKGLWAGALGGTRTPNLLIRSQMLYPLSYERSHCRILHFGPSRFVLDIDHRPDRGTLEGIPPV